jgi:hypothetical protein
MRGVAAGLLRGDQKPYRDSKSLGVSKARILNLKKAQGTTTTAAALSRTFLIFGQEFVS